MGLSMAFDTINHDLLLAKVKAYGFLKTSIKFHVSLPGEHKTKSSNQQ